MKSLRSWLFLFAFASGAACAPMNTSRTELATVGPDEGIVFGSILVGVDKSEADPSTWDFLKGRKAEDSHYSLSFARDNFNPFKPKYTATVDPYEVEEFIRKLPAGEYRLGELEQMGFTNLVLSLSRFHFRVTPGRVTYVGRLHVQFPERLTVGTAVETVVEDREQTTIKALKGSYDEALFADVNRDLMSRD